MAAGFKTATVRSGDVPATQTDFPTYVDLDRLGITTLAEAESVRVYADSAKTTEWAREIVSATEMHVKVPSLTSTVEIFVDWDGVRADYAVGATYGRNAVWVDYEGVWHLGEAVNNSSDGYLDSTGNGNHGTGRSMALAAVDSPTGKGQDFDGAADGITVPSSSSIDAPTTNQKLTISSWIKKDAVGGTPQDYIVGGLNTYSIIHGYVRNTYELFSSGLRYTIGVVTDTDWNYIATSFDNSANTSISSVNGSNSTSSEGGSLSTASNNFIIGAASASNNFNGKISEVRVRSDVLSGNWFTTEYNNQNAEATFWGTWTDAGGGGGGAAQAARRGVIMMM